MRDVPSAEVLELLAWIVKEPVGAMVEGEVVVLLTTWE